jgi:hypothetical protein
VKRTGWVMVAGLGLLLPLLASPSWALEVVFNKTSLTFQVGSTASQQLGVLVRNLPAGTQLGFASFYLLYDKTKLELSNFVFDSTVLDTKGVDTEEPDGINVSAARISATGNVDPNRPLLTFDVKIVSGAPAGQYPIRFKVGDPLNVLQDINGADLAVASWGTCTVTISSGPPNPARPLTWAFAPRQKDPVSAQLSWTDGTAQEVQVQYRLPGGTWQSVPATAITLDVAHKKATVAWDTPTPPGSTQTVEVRARALDQGKVWDPQQQKVVDADNVGWVAAATTLTIDNEPPRLVSASGAQTTITLNFQAGEVLDTTTSQNKANYAVVQVQGGEAQAGQAISVTAAQRVSDTVVKLTVSPALTPNAKYRVTAQNIADAVGNVMPQPSSQDFVAVPKPMLVNGRFLDKTHLDIEFNMAMVASTVEVPAQWKVEKKGTGATVAVSAAKLLADEKTVRLTLAAALEQNTTYQVTGPAQAKGKDTDQTLGTTDNKVDVTTPWWQELSAGKYMVGVPLHVPGRVRNVMGAQWVAVWDATLNGGQGGYVYDDGTTHPGRQAINFADGRGYWVQLAQPATAYFTGGTPLTSDVALPELPRGWFIVADPFLDRDLPITQVEGCARFAWHYDGTAWHLVLPAVPADLNLPNVGTKLLRWKGYFVYKAQPGAITLKRAGQPSGVEVGEELKGAVLVPLVVRAAGAEDTVNFCGVGAKPLQVLNPPAVGPVDLYFVQEGAAPMAVDVRTGSVAQKWELVASTTLPNTQVTVAAPDLSKVPSDYAVILTDLETGQKTYLRTSAGYTFTSGPQGGQRRLRLEIVPRSQTLLLSGVAVQQVSGRQVVITYQLSGPAAVTAEVRNIAGRVIQRLATDKPQSGGTCTLVWNLQNAAGSPVPRGTYLIALQARTDDGQQMRTLQPFAVNR